LPGEEMRLLSGPDDSGFWGEINASRRFSFVKDEAGTVRAMIIHEIIRCPKLR
jgi:hypothetical protein